MEDPGTYVLVIRITREEEIAVGRLGAFSLPPGYYLYVGSARGPGGLGARLARHLKKVGKPHWHIDYLLQRGRVVETWRASSPERLECAWAQHLLQMPEARIAIPRFGSSDCGCPSHLIFFPFPPSFHSFAERLRVADSNSCLLREVPPEVGRF